MTEFEIKVKSSVEALFMTYQKQLNDLNAKELSRQAGNVDKYWTEIVMGNQTELDRQRTDLAGKMRGMIELHNILFDGVIGDMKLSAGDDLSIVYESKKPESEVK